MTTAFRLEELSALATRPFHDEYFRAASRAARWLSEQDPAELVGDDSVGWWLLIYAGLRPPRRLRQEMNRRLSDLLPRLRMGRSEVYTATVLARTLQRCGALQNRSKVCFRLQELLTSLSDPPHRLWSRQNLRADLAWTCQSLFELGWLDEQSHVSVVRNILVDVPFDSFLPAAQLWPVARASLTDLERREFSSKLQDACNSVKDPSRLTEFLDWEVSYLLLFFASRDDIAAARMVGDYLLSRQTESQWDEATEENIEATSLVGLAFCRLWAASQALIFAENPAIAAENVLRHTLWHTIRTEERLEDRWEAVLGARDLATKGRLLEDFLRFYAESSPGLSVQEVRLRTASEEIDLLLEKDRTFEVPRDLPGQYILVECKYKKKKSGADEIRDFQGKLLNRPRSTCKLGVFVSMAGFSRDSKTEVMRFNSRESEKILALVNGDEVDEAVRGGRSLVALISDAILATSKI